MASSETDKTDVMNRIWMGSNKLAGYSIYIDDTPSPIDKVNLFFKNDCTKFIGLNERDA